MKLLKKISLVYLLQIFAVILLFGYTDSTSEPAINKNSVIRINKTHTIKTDEDSIINSKSNSDAEMISVGTKH
jgi:hypothetical protein